MQNKSLRGYNINFQIKTFIMNGHMNCHNMFMLWMFGRELEQVYGLLADLNPRQVESRSYRPRHDLFHWPLGRRPDDHPGLSDLGL